MQVLHLETSNSAMAEDLLSKTAIIEHYVMETKSGISSLLYDAVHCIFSTHTHTHTRLTVLFPGLPGWAGTRKVKPIRILLKQETVSSSGISWAICKSAPRSRQITTPAPHHSVFTGRMPFLPPSQQRQSTEGTAFFSTVCHICHKHIYHQLCCVVSEIKKCGHGAHLPFLGWCHTYGYLPSHRASLSFYQYQIILLDDRGTFVWGCYSWEEWSGVEPTTCCYLLGKRRAPSC